MDENLAIKALETATKLLDEMHRTIHNARDRAERELDEAKALHAKEIERARVDSARQQMALHDCYQQHRDDLLARIEALEKQNADLLAALLPSNRPTP